MNAIRLVAALPLLAVLFIPAVAIGGLMYEASVGGQKFGFTPFGAKKK